MDFSVKIQYSEGLAVLNILGRYHLCVVWKPDTLSTHY